MSRLLAAAILAAALPAAARAELFLTMTQQGNDVVLSGSGSLNLSGLNYSFSGTAITGIFPSQGVVFSGPNGGAVDVYTGPTSFGTGGGLGFSSASGVVAGVNPATGNLVVPRGYESGGSITTGGVFANQTFASLGVTPGTYRWFWDTTPPARPDVRGFGPYSPNPGGTSGITLTVQAVPEPGTIGLGLSAGLTALAGWRTRRRWVG